MGIGKIVICSGVVGIRVLSKRVSLLGSPELWSGADRSVGRKNISKGPRREVSYISSAVPIIHHHVCTEIHLLQIPDIPSVVLYIRLGVMQFMVSFPEAQTSRFRGFET